jgi:acetoin utilization protein AcuC
LAQSGCRASGTGPSETEILVVYGAGLEAYNFGLSHPLQPLRYRLTIALMRALGLLDGRRVRLVEPRHASVSELLSVHSYPYVQAVRRAQNIALTRAEPADLTFYGLGNADNPLFPSIYGASCLATGASLVAVDAILEGRACHAYNMAGGLHHALPDRASGFCIFNDAAVAIRRAVDAGMRVAYVDLDAHHGDGVQEIFYRDPRVLTVSVHESGRFLFPGTGAVAEQGDGPGAGTSINLPLPPQAGDRSFLAAVEEVIEPAVRAFRPDLLVTQTGCDTHWSDPLTHLGATMRLYPVLGERMHALAHEAAAGRWLILGGGGYDPLSVTPRAWTAFFAGALGEGRCDRPLPPEWAELVRSQGGSVPDTLLGDRGPGFEALGRSAVAPFIDCLREAVIERLPVLARR